MVAPLAAGIVGGLSNLVNFAAGRGVYLLIWSIAHLAVVAVGYWAVQRRRPSDRINLYVFLGVLAGLVEAVVVFGLLEGLVVGRGVDLLELSTGFEDYVAAAATALLFAAGAVYGLRATGAPAAVARIKGSGANGIQLAAAAVTLLAAALELLSK